MKIINANNGRFVFAGAIRSENAQKVIAEQSRFSINSELFKELQSKGSFAASRSYSQNIKTGRKDLKLVDIGKPGFSVGIFLSVFEFVAKKFKIES